MVVTEAGEVVDRFRREHTDGRIRDEDIPEATVPATERGLGAPEFDADGVGEIDEQVDQFGRNPLLDRGVGDIVTGEDLVEVVYGRDRAIVWVVPTKNVQRNGVGLMWR